MATNWIPITKQIVQSHMMAIELEIYTTVEIDDGQTPEQLLEEFIEQVVDTARGYCATAVREGYLKSMGPEGTVPRRMVLKVCNIIRYELATRIPGMARFITEPRQKQQESDEKYLAGVAKGSPSMDDPDQEETAVFAPSPSINARPKQFGRHQQDGI